MPATGRARVERALALRPVEDVPVSYWGHTYLEEWSARELADVTVARARRHQLDFVKIQTRATCFGEAFGAQFTPAGTPYDKPIVGPYPITEDRDWRRVADRDVSWAPLDEQVECVRLTAEALGPDIPVLQTVFSPATICGYLCGKQLAPVIRGLQAEPAALRQLMIVITQVLARYIERSIAAGAAGIYYAVGWDAASADVTDWAWYAQHLLPWDELVLSRLPQEAWFTVLHLCGPHVHFELAGRLPTKVTSWSIHDAGNPGLAEGRDRSGKPVMGGVEREGALLHGPPSALQAQIDAAIESTGRQGFLLAPGCSISPRTSDAQLAILAGRTEQKREKRKAACR
jgi:uroporphyrinogen decarboxylase